MRIMSLTLFLAAGILFISACEPELIPVPDPTQAATPLPANTTSAAPLPTLPGESQTMPAPQASPSNSDGWNAYPPAAGDAKLQRGNFFVDSASVGPVPGKPGQIGLFVEGSLPTPCNQLRASINPPDAENRVVVEVYSVVDPNMICTEVLKPFTGQVAALAGYPAGKYTVVVNGMEAGGFEVKQVHQ